MSARRQHRWTARVLLGLLLLLAVAAAVVAWFPARWAWQLARRHVPQLQLRSTSGTVWDGRSVVNAYGRPLGTLQWHVARSALWGDVHGRFDLEASRWNVSGHFVRPGPDQLVVSDVHARLPASLLGHPGMLRGLQPDGMLQVVVPHARLDHGWPVQGKARVDWVGAGLVDGKERAALGHLVARIRSRAGTTLEARLSDAGDGPVAVSGDATVTPLGWRLDATLTPRAGDPARQRILARLGRAGADGSIHVRRHAGLFPGAPP